MIVITQEQLAGANALFQKKNLLQERISLMEGVDSVKDSIIAAKALEISMLRQAGENYKLQIDKMKQIQNYDVLRYEQDKRKLRRTCWVVGGVCVSVGISAGILIMALK